MKKICTIFLWKCSSLDIYGILKGKPKKQKFISLLNDGKHVYYAGHAHILVSIDADMIAKAKLVYKIWNIDVTVFTLEEFRLYLVEQRLKDTSVPALFERFNHAIELPTLFEQYKLDQFFVQKGLPTWYLGYFNTLTCASIHGNMYYYFNQWFPNIPLAILTIELERVIDKLVDYFGTDELGREKLDIKELKEKDWKGREWRRGEMGIVF